MGPCEDFEKATEVGPLIVRENFCGCKMCVAPLYESNMCLVPHVTGYTRKVTTKRITTVAPRVTRGLSLTVLAGKLNSGEVRAVRVALDQTGIEGGFWLVLLTSDFFLASADVLHGGEEFKKGSLLVKVKWYEFVDIGVNGVRCYRLLPEEKVISVMAIIRIESPSLVSRAGLFELSKSENSRITDSI